VGAGFARMIGDGGYQAPRDLSFATPQRRPKRLTVALKRRYTALVTRMFGAIGRKKVTRWRTALAQP